MADLFQRSFAAGELAPGLGARADLAKYTIGLRSCRNFLVRRHGGVSNRPGTKFVGEAKNEGPTYLKPFTFAAADQSYVIEVGEQYFRFHYEGAPVVVSGVAAYNGGTAYVPGDLVVQGGVNYYCKAATTGNAPPNATYWHPLEGNIYEIPTPYVEGRFMAPAPACFQQSGDVITITHLEEPPRELRRYSATRWVLSAAITTGPAIGAPTAGAGSGTAAALTRKYVVTAVSEETYEESNPSSVITVINIAAPTAAAPITLTWTPPATGVAVEYKVYADPHGNGTFGYVGTATGAASFRVTSDDADYFNTPPIPRALFAGVNNYPAVSTTFQQRRIFAGTHNDRQVAYASQVGRYTNFGIRSPLQDDDAVTFRFAGTRIHPVHHLAELPQGLVVLTDGGEWICEGDETGALTPTAINPRQHGYAGSAYTPPVVVGNSLLFLQGRGTILRDLRFDERVEGLSGRDLCLYAAHLFDGFSITALAYAQVPHSTVWAVRSDGTLLGLTYIPEEDVWGWHRHDTDGLFEDVCVIPEGTEDAVYVVVKRTISGNTRRYIERFATRQFTDIKDGVFLDSALSYSGTAKTTFTGLSHLVGKSVKALADGVVVGPYTVSSSGSITLAAAASKVHVGLPITAELETLDLDVAGSSLRAARKRVFALRLLLEASARGFTAGPDATHQKTVTANAWDAAGLVTDPVDLTLTSHFNDTGRTLIRHTDPTPLTVLGVIPSFETGG